MSQRRFDRSKTVVPGSKETKNGDSTPVRPKVAEVGRPQPARKVIAHRPNIVRPVVRPKRINNLPESKKVEEKFNLKQNSKIGGQQDVNSDLKTSRSKEKKVNISLLLLR